MRSSEVRNVTAALRPPGRPTALLKRIVARWFLRQREFTCQEPFSHTRLDTWALALSGSPADIERRLRDLADQIIERATT
jgi:hypothetical protein